MKKFLERFSKKTKPEAQEQSAVNEPPTSPRKKRGLDRFTILSWAVTILLTVSLLGGTLYYKSTLPPVVVTVPAEATEESAAGQPQVGTPGHERVSGDLDAGRQPQPAARAPRVLARRCHRGVLRHP